MEAQDQNEYPDRLGEQDEIPGLEILQHAEFALWMAVILIPLLFYVNGSAVSSDQWYVRAALIAIAYAGAPIVTCLKHCSAKRQTVIPDLAGESIDLAGPSGSQYRDAEGDLDQ